MAEKNARQRQILMMSHMQLEVLSGSEKNITSEDSWIEKNYLSDSDDSNTVTSTFRADVSEDEDIHAEHKEDNDHDSEASFDEEDEDQVYQLGPFSSSLPFWHLHAIGGKRLGPGIATS